MKNRKRKKIILAAVKAAMSKPKNWVQIGYAARRPNYFPIGKEIGRFESIRFIESPPYK